MGGVGENVGEGEDDGWGVGEGGRNVAVGKSGVVVGSRVAVMDNGAAVEAG